MWRAMSSAKVMASWSKEWGPRESPRRRTPTPPSLSSIGSARRPRSPRRQYSSAVARASSLVCATSGMWKRRRSCTTSASTGRDESCRRVPIVGSAPSPYAAAMRRSSSPSGTATQQDVVPVPRAATATRASRAESRQVSGASPPAKCALRRRAGAQQERLDVAPPVPTVASRAAIAAHTTLVAPVTQRVEADAERGGRLGEAEPLLPVRLTHSHRARSPGRA